MAPPRVWYRVRIGRFAVFLEDVDIRPLMTNCQKRPASGPHNAGQNLSGVQKLLHTQEAWGSSTYAATILSGIYKQEVDLLQSSRGTDLPCKKWAFVHTTAHRAPTEVWAVRHPTANDVKFTVFFPGQQQHEWQPLLAYIHIADVLANLPA